MITVELNEQEIELLLILLHAQVTELRRKRPDCELLEGDKWEGALEDKLHTARHALMKKLYPQNWAGRQ